MKAYFISGLGADRQAFEKIELPAGYNISFLDWIPPEKNEPLHVYAARLAKFIDANNPFILIGLSFGGMVAIEIAKILQPQKIIIISSLASINELPWYFKHAGKLGLQKVIPVGVLKSATLINRIMNAKSRHEVAIVKRYLNQTTGSFIRWSLHAILSWQHNYRLANVVHIHGSRDHLLPHRYTQPDYIIEKGGHLMILNKSKEINLLLGKILAE